MEELELTYKWNTEKEIKTKYGPIKLPIEDIKNLVKNKKNSLRIEALLNAISMGRHGEGEWKKGKRGTFINIPVKNIKGDIYSAILLKMNGNAIVDVETAFLSD
jgi:hypothetical protein